LGGAALDIYGKIEENQGWKSSETVDAVGFAPTASILFRFYVMVKQYRCAQPKGLPKTKPKPSEAGSVWRGGATK